MQTDVLIIGAGPVGIFTAFQAGMLKMRSCIVDTLEFIGGQCNALYPEKPIYDIPGYPEITAAELIENLSRQASSFNPEYILGNQVISLKKIDNYFQVTTNKNIIISAKIIVIAAGCGAFGPNKPPLIGLAEYENKSVFYSVTDKEKFRDAEIVIAGGGDSAIDWAINLSNVSKKIYLVHRREKFRSIPANMDIINQLVAQNKIELIVPYHLHSLVGENGALQEVIVQDLSKNNKTINAQYLLSFFGLSMDIGPIRNWGLSYSTNHILVNQVNNQTDIEGIYAVGDICHYPGKLKLILTGFAEAAAAIHHSYSRVFEGKHLHFEYSTTKGIK